MAEQDDSGSPLLPQDASPATLQQHLRGHRLMRRMSSMEVDGISAALQAINEEKQHITEAEGLSQVSFFLGVLNVPLLCIVLAWWPEHFWVLYCGECLFLIPSWLITVHRVYNGALFVLDFCWVVNIFFTLYMFRMLWGPWEEEHCLQNFLVFFSVSLGPLGWACVVLHNGLVFHSIEKTASLTIHLVPVFVAWTVVKFNDKMQDAWPGRFPTTEQLALVPLQHLYTYGLALYVVWWVLHSAWLLSVGVDQPDKGRDTVFVGIYNKAKLGPILERRTGCANIRCHAAVYLVVHFLLCLLAFLWPMLCFWSIEVHLGFGVFVFAGAAWSGAGYYEYIMAHRYTKVVKQLLKKREGEKSSRARDQLATV